MRVAQDVCRDLDRATTMEWLETNGLGGFASATITGLHSRRYHGLLMAATRPPVGRVLLLSKLEETLHVGGDTYEISVNQYPGTFHPQGQQYLESFDTLPIPTWIYRAGPAVIRKSVFMPHGENSTVIQYELLEGPSHASLELRPLIAFRDYHSTTHRNDALRGDVQFEPGLARMKPYADQPELFLAHNATEARAEGNWYLNFEFEAERHRGLDFREDLFNPLVLRFSLHRDQPATVIASLQARRAEDAQGLLACELERREALTDGLEEPLIAALTRAADQFIVKRGDLHSVIAGYPWFGDWGRDTMIALPGLTLCTGLDEVARDILREFSRHIDRGMLPNRFPDAGETPEYNTVDATLWFFEAVRDYVEETADEEFAREMYPFLKDIFEWHERGTRYGIRVDTDGLLACGEPGVQLTWMDAKVGDWVVTPRTGKPVEIQALWYNALHVLEDFASRFEPTREFQTRVNLLAAKVRTSFQEAFWNEAEQCLFDVITPGGPDASIRPNQVFAISLEHPLVEGPRAMSILSVVERELLTPLGLRTLSPRDAAYCGTYGGGPRERDGAYHQGTVWPWLLGPFVMAYLRVHPDRRAAQTQAAQWLAPMLGHLAEAGLDQLSEVANGDAPHTPGGCTAQAWSVGEVLRAALAVQDIAES